MRKTLSVFFSFFFLALHAIAQDASSPFGSPAQNDNTLYVVIFALIAFGFVLLMFGNAFGSGVSQAVAFNDEVAEKRKEKVREARERKERERAEAEERRKAAEEKRKADEAKLLAALEAKRKAEAEKNARKNAVKALDALTPEEAELTEYTTDEFLTKVIKGKHMIERLKRDVGMPEHNDDTDIVSGGKMYSYGNGRQIIVQLTDLNADKIRKKILSDAAAAEARRLAAEAKARNAKIRLFVTVFAVVLAVLIFFVVADKI